MILSFAFQYCDHMKSNEYVVMFLMYPGNRPQRLFTNRMKSWRYLNKIFKTVNIVLPDPGMENGLRTINRLRTYWSYNKNLTKHQILHLECQMENGTSQLFTVREFQLE